MGKYSERRKVTFQREICGRLPRDAVQLIHPEKAVAIESGVLLVHGSWSTPSLLCLRCWERPLREVRLPKPWLYVVDEALLSFDLSQRLLGEWAEAGTAYGIRERCIAWRRSGHGDHCARIAALCSELESAPPQSSRVPVMTPRDETDFSELFEMPPQTVRSSRALMENS